MRTLNIFPRICDYLWVAEDGIKMQVFSLMSWTPFIFTFSWNDCSNSILFHTRCGTAKLVWYLLSVGLLDQKCKYLIFLAVCLPWYLWKMEVHGLFLYSKNNEKLEDLMMILVNSSFYALRLLWVFNWKYREKCMLLHAECLECTRGGFQLMGFSMNPLWWFDLQCRVFYSDLLQQYSLSFYDGLRKLIASCLLPRKMAVYRT